jgi:hypothetical protein
MAAHYEFIQVRFADEIDTERAAGRSASPRPSIFLGRLACLLQTMRLRHREAPHGPRGD